MPDQPQAKRPHFILRNTSKTVGFTAHSPGGGPTQNVPALPRPQQSASLRAQIEILKPAVAEAVRVQGELQLESGLGLQIQFSSQPDVELAFESLADARKRIELLSVRHEGNRTFANVFVPDGKLAHFEKYISDYLEELLVLVAEHRVDADCEQPEPSDAEDCRQLMALREMRGGELVVAGSDEGETG